MPRSRNTLEQKINYIIRPAKNIERKMLCETLQKLSYFNHLDKYAYIGTLKGLIELVELFEKK